MDEEISPESFQSILNAGWNQMEELSLGDTRGNQNMSNLAVDATLNTCPRCAALEAELATARADVDAAATEFLLPVPKPGTDMARMMIASRMKGRERDEIWKQRDAARALLAELAAATGAYLGLEEKVGSGERDPRGSELAVEIVRGRLQGVIRRAEAEAGGGAG